MDAASRNPTENLLAATERQEFAFLTLRGSSLAEVRPSIRNAGWRFRTILGIESISPAVARNEPSWVSSRKRSATSKGLCCDQRARARGTAFRVADCPSFNLLNRVVGRDGASL